MLALIKIVLIRSDVVEELAVEGSTRIDTNTPLPHLKLGGQSDLFFRHRRLGDMIEIYQRVETSLQGIFETPVNQWEAF